MKKWILGKGDVVLLDDDDYEKISKAGWYVTNSGNSRTSYVVHDNFGRLHRYILGITDPNIVVDHINRNGLDNRKENLRATNNQINKRNQSVCSNNKFNFNGIKYEKKSGNHSARIRVSWAEYDYNKEQKRNKTKSKSFSISKYSLNEALRLAVKTRIEKMREFDYFIDERSEAIEREVQNINVDMEKLLSIDLSSLVE